jgi:hypothetical protein
VLPVSVTVPPDGVSTPLLGSLTLAEAAEPIATELNASPATAATIAPRLSRAARISVFTGSLLVGLSVCASVLLFGDLPRTGGEPWLRVRLNRYPIRPVT